MNLITHRQVVPQVVPLLGDVGAQVAAEPHQAFLLLVFGALPSTVPAVLGVSRGALRTAGASACTQQQMK